jgi:hypothetical protein
VTLQEDAKTGAKHSVVPFSARETFRLLTTVGAAVLLLTCLQFGLVELALVGHFPVGQRTVGMYPVAVITIVFLATGAAPWLMFNDLRGKFSRREARAVSIAFGVLTPVTLATGLALAGIPGSYAELLLGSAFGLVGAFAGTVLVTTLLSFGLCLFTLWVTRRIERIERHGLPSTGV